MTGRLISSSGIWRNSWQENKEINTFSMHCIRVFPVPDVCFGSFPCLCKERRDGQVMLPCVGFCGQLMTPPVTNDPRQAGFTDRFEFERCNTCREEEDAAPESKSQCSFVCQEPFCLFFLFLNF